MAGDPWIAGISGQTSANETSGIVFADGADSTDVSRQTFVHVVAFLVRISNESFEAPTDVAALCVVTGSILAAHVRTITLGNVFARHLRVAGEARRTSALV